MAERLASYWVGLMVEWLDIERAVWWVVRMDSYWVDYSVHLMVDLMAASKDMKTAEHLAHKMADLMVVPRECYLVSQMVAKWDL
jgi:hypothetical protein